MKPCPMSSHITRWFVTSFSCRIISRITMAY